MGWTILAVVAVSVGVVGIVLAIVGIRRASDLGSSREAHRDRVSRAEGGIFKGKTRVSRIRDFIYLDASRLYSLYSQVFEGIADRVVSSHIQQLSSAEGQRAILEGGSVRTHLTQVAGQTESRLLYDHMYSQLEDALKSTIVEGNSEESVLKGATLVRATGPAELEDFSRLREFLDHFNTLGEAIAYATAVGSGTSPGKSSIKALANKLGLRQDEQNLKNLALFIDLFNQGSFEVVVVPEALAGQRAFRGILDRSHLRVTPQSLRSLYGPFPMSPWTIVGEITYTPYLDHDAHPGLSTTPEDTVVDDDRPFMRDPFRSLFRASAAFEQMFSESGSRTEIVIAPLAIYRDMSL